jgi:hypothetical protein
LRSLVLGFYDLSFDTLLSFEVGCFRCEQFDIVIFSFRLNYLVIEVLRETLILFECKNKNAKHGKKCGGENLWEKNIFFNKKSK